MTVGTLLNFIKKQQLSYFGHVKRHKTLEKLILVGNVKGQRNTEGPKRSWEKDAEDWIGASVWRVGRTAEEILGEGCGGLDWGKCLESGTNSRRDLGRRMWRTGLGQVSGEWDEQQKISWEKDVEDWIGASVWRVGRTAEEISGEGCGGLDWGKCLESGTNSRRDLGRRMWRTGLGQVSGEWDEQQKRSWEKDVEDWIGASVWRVGRIAKEILGEGCGGLDWGKCLESGTNSRRDLGRRMWRTGLGQVSGEWDEQQKRSWEKDVEDWIGASVWRVGRTAEDRLMYNNQKIQQGSNIRKQEKRQRRTTSREPLQ